MMPDSDPRPDPRADDDESLEPYFNDDTSFEAEAEEEE